MIASDIKDKSTTKETLLFARDETCASVSGCQLQFVVLVSKRIFPHFQEYFSFRNSTLAFKNYCLELYIAAEHFFHVEQYLQ